MQRVENPQQWRARKSPKQSQKTSSCQSSVYHSVSSSLFSCADGEALTTNFIWAKRIASAKREVGDCVSQYRDRLLIPSVCVALQVDGRLWMGPILKSDADIPSADADVSEARVRPSAAGSSLPARHESSGRKDMPVRSERVKRRPTRLTLINDLCVVNWTIVVGRIAVRRMNTF